MAAALDAAVRTVRLSGTEPDDTIRWEMARRILSAAGDGASTPLALAEAALHGRWISDHIRQGSHADPISNEAKEGRIRPAVRLRPGGNKIALLQKDTDVEEAP
jgi:hypothetical protein